MTAHHHHDLQHKFGLTPEEYLEIRRLAGLCNLYDNIELKLNYEILEIRPSTQKNDFMYYLDGQLVGYLALFQFNSKEAEVSGMVHPDFRRQGIFTQLVQAAVEELRNRNVPKMIFILQSTSATGRAFLEQFGTHYEFSEYWMRMTEMKLPPLRDPIELRLATDEDYPAIAKMQAAAFNMNEAEHLHSLRTRPKRPDSYRCMVELAGQSIGTISVHHHDQAAFFYGFCIEEEMRGRGYGRQALSLTVQKALAEGYAKIELEVAVENQNALSLYQSCGFSVITANDYYVLMLTEASKK